MNFITPQIKLHRAFHQSVIHAEKSCQRLLLLWRIFLASGADWNCGLGYQWDAQSQRFPFSLPNLCSTYSIHSITGILSCAKCLCGLTPHDKRRSQILVLSSSYSVGLRWSWESNEKMKRKQKILPLWTRHLEKRYRVKNFPLAQGCSITIFIKSFPESTRFLISTTFHYLFMRFLSSLHSSTILSCSNFTFKNSRLKISPWFYLKKTRYK